VNALLNIAFRSIVFAVTNVVDIKSTGAWISVTIGVVIDDNTDSTGVCANVYTGNVSSGDVDNVDASVDNAVSKGDKAEGSMASVVKVVAILAVTGNMSMLTVSKEFCNTVIIVSMSNV
jgi:hypothetical protein